MAPMNRVLLGLAVGVVCGLVGLFIQRRRRSELDRQARRLSSLGTVAGHREARRDDGR